MPHLLHFGEDILMGREFAIQTEEFLLLLSQLLYNEKSMLSARVQKGLDEMIQGDTTTCIGKEHESRTLISILLRFAGSILDKARGLRPDEWGRANRPLPLRDLKQRK